MPPWWKNYSQVSPQKSFEILHFSRWVKQSPLGYWDRLSQRYMNKIMAAKGKKLFTLCLHWTEVAKIKSESTTPVIKNLHTSVLFKMLSDFIFHYKIKIHSIYSLQLFSLNQLLALYFMVLLTLDLVQVFFNHEKLPPVFQFIIVPLGKYDQKTYLKSSPTSKMELSAKIVNGWMPLTVYAKRPILDNQLGFEYDSVSYKVSVNKF